MFPHSQVLSVILVAMAGALFHDLANGQPRVPEPTSNTGTPPAGATSVAPATVQAGDPAITALIAELEAKKQAVEGDTSLEEAARTQAVQSLSATREAGASRRRGEALEHRLHRSSLSRRWTGPGGVRQRYHHARQVGTRGSRTCDAPRRGARDFVPYGRVIGSGEI